MPPVEARFAVNLRPETIDPGFRARLRPWGYLAPPANLTAETRTTAQTLQDGGRGLIVDNGMFDEIGRIAHAHTADGAAVEAELDTLTELIGHHPIRAELAATLRARVDALAAATASEARRATRVAEDLQLALAPTAIIGVEDATAATWLRVGLDAPLIRDLRRALRRRNEAVARGGAEAARTLSSVAPKVRYLPVASALNYDTAFDAGQAFARAGLTGAAMGFGAYMADDLFTEHITIHGRRRRLPAALPQRYLRCALAARGFWDGWHSATGEAPEAFHFLGLGAPIMIAITVLAAMETPLLTFDATSPIKDAAEGTFYFSKPTYLKVRARRAAEHLASGRWKRWSCRCPFCAAFTEAHPFDYDRGRASAASRVDSLRTEDLRPEGALFDAYPLLSEPGPGSLRGEVTAARSGHNHWVLQRVLADIRRNSHTSRALIAHVRTIVESYQQATQADHFAIAVQTSFELASTPVR